jgi:PST family polysaccharide transporter
VSRADVGRYSIALSVTALAWILPAALETVLLPRTADLHAAHGRGEIAAEESDQATARAVRHGVVLLAPATAIVVVLVVVGVPLLYGREFIKTVWFGLILVPGVVGLSLGKTLSAVVTGRGRPHYALLTTLITVPLTVALYLLLIPALGGYGAAIASSVSYLTSTALALVWFQRTTAIPLRVALVPSGAELHDYGDAVAQVRRRLRARAA